MSLSDLMTSDMTAVFLNTQDFGQSATYAARNGTTPFACTVTPTDPSPSMVQISQGIEDRRESRFLASRTALRAGLLADFGTVRDPARGDTVTIASGADAGEWTVRTIAMDIGDGVMLDCVQSDLYSLGASGATESR